MLFRSEHELGEKTRAAALVQKALAELRKTSRVGLITTALHRQYRARFERRLMRLERPGRATHLEPMPERTLMEVIEAESRAAGPESNGEA